MSPYAGVPSLPRNGTLVPGASFTGQAEAPRRSAARWAKAVRLRAGFPPRVRRCGPPAPHHRLDQVLSISNTPDRRPVTSSGEDWLGQL